MTEKSEDSKESEKNMTEKDDNKQIKAILGAGLVSIVTNFLERLKELL